MKLTVLSVAYPLAPVGPDAVGGAEQILTHLDAALVRAGHRSIVVACEGSETAGTLVPTPLPKRTLTDEVKWQVQQQHRARIEQALQQWPIDLIHMHGIDFDRYLPPPGVPALVTLHLPPAWYAQEVWDLNRPETYLHCVSRSQRSAISGQGSVAPLQGLGVRGQGSGTAPPGSALTRDPSPLTPAYPVIENGVPTAALAARHAKRRFVMTFGRICPEKGFHLALDAAARARMPILLAGEVFPYETHVQYFQQEILPRLDDTRRFIGPVGFARKRRLLSAARCLLVPSLAPETSSLVAMEALACGTPVVAFRAGALPEIIEPGKTGFLVNDEREMADAIAAAGELDPETCRAVARTRFSLDRMTAQYFAAYEALAQSSAADLSPVPSPTRGGGTQAGGWSSDPSPRTQAPPSLLGKGAGGLGSDPAPRRGGGAQASIQNPNGQRAPEIQNREGSRRHAA